MTGLVVPPDDAARAGRLRGDDRPLRAALGQEGRRRALARFSRPRKLSRFVEMVESATGVAG